MGIKHVYIKPALPYLNGKVERSHIVDAEKFYKCFKYTGDMDLNKKIKLWQDYYNHIRPHGAHNGSSPLEILFTKMNQQKSLNEKRRIDSNKLTLNRPVVPF